MIRFRTDENLPPTEAAEMLMEQGHDALTVWDQVLRGEPDGEIAGALRRERHAFVTLDQGFANIRFYPPGEFSGFIVLRLVTQDQTHVLAALRRVASLLASEPGAGCLWIVDEESVRIRQSGTKP